MQISQSDLCLARERLAKYFYEKEGDRVCAPFPPWEKKDPWVIHSIAAAYKKADEIINIMFPEEE